MLTYIYHRPIKINSDLVEIKYELLMLDNYISLFLSRMFRWEIIQMPTCEGPFAASSKWCELDIYSRIICQKRENTQLPTYLVINKCTFSISELTVCIYFWYINYYLSLKYVAFLWHCKNNNISYRVYSGVYNMIYIICV